MTADKLHAHALLDRLPANQTNTAVLFLEFLLLEDEEISTEEESMPPYRRQFLIPKKLRILKPTYQHQG